MALFAAMTAPITKTNHGRTVILSAFLLAVIASGIPQVEIHNHEDAYFGHEHSVGHHHDDHYSDNVSAGDVDGLGNSGSKHAHDPGVSAVTLIYAANLSVANSYFVA